MTGEWRWRCASCPTTGSASSYRLALAELLAHDAAAHSRGVAA
jgi:hypothetical protein